MFKSMMGWTAGLALALSPAVGFASMVHLVGGTGSGYSPPLSPPPVLLASTFHPYADSTGDHVTFTNMQEEDVPDGIGILFSTPATSADSLVFTSPGFKSTDGVNGDGISQNVEGIFSADIQAMTGLALNSLVFNAGGNYSLLPAFGGGGTNPTAHVTSNVHIDITSVSGQAPASPLSIDTALAIDSGGNFTTIPVGQLYVQGASWSGSVTVNLDQFLTDHAIAGSVTGVSLTFDTNLWTTASPTTSATILQKPASIIVATGQETLVPVPSAAGGAIGLLGGLVLFELLGRRRRRHVA